MLYHINPETLVPSACHAVKKTCPYGNAESHFDSMSAAYQHIENQYKTSEIKTFVKKEGKSDSSYNAKDNSLASTPQQVKDKFEKDIKGKFFTLKGYDENKGTPGLKLEELFGLKKDSKASADLGQVELKTHRSSGRGNNVTLGSLSLINKNKFKALIGKGYVRKSMSTQSWQTIGNHRFALFVDYKHQKLRMIVADKDGSNLTNTQDFYWTFDQINNRIKEKYEHIAIAHYDIKEDRGQTKVRYTDLTMVSHNLHTFIDDIDQGKINIEAYFNGERTAKFVFWSEYDALISHIEE